MIEIPDKRTTEKLEEILKDYDATIDINKGRSEKGPEEDSVESPELSGPDDGDNLG